MFKKIFLKSLKKSFHSLGYLHICLTSEKCLVESKEEIQTPIYQFTTV